MTARQKLFAAALTLALPLGAFAQAPAAPAEPEKPAAPPAAAKPAEPAKPPLVQVYGTLNVNLQYTEASESTNPAQNVRPRFAVSIDSSNVGVRGTLELIDGVKGIYQCETQASIDGEDLRALCGRNSRVGLSTNWGTLFYGNWDSPFKAGHYGTKADDPFIDTDVSGFQGIMGSPGYGVRSSAWISASPTATTNAAGVVTAVTPVATASFDHRVANSVTYWTPKFSGLSAKVQVGVDEFRSAKFSGAPQFGNGLVDPLLASAVVNYDAGPLSVVATAEYHEDAYGLRVINPANNGLTSSKDYAWRVAAGYDIPVGESVLNVMGMVDQLFYKQDDSGSGFKDYNRFAYLVGAKYRMGSHELRGRYSQALDPDITAASGTTLAAGAKDKLGAKSYAVGYGYYLAKSTQVYAFYTEIMNDDRARYTFPISGAAALVAGNTGAGAALRAGGLGIRLAF
jgi:predicted porin